MSTLSETATNEYYERTLENTDDWVYSICRERLKSDLEITTLKQFILQELPTLQAVDLNEKYFKKIIWRKFSPTYRKELTATKREAIVKAAFCGAIIREFALREEKTIPFFNQHHQRLLELFPDFQSLNEHEIVLLTRFYRGVLIASNFMKGKQNKELFLEIGRLLECSGNKYVTGGSCTNVTKRRLSIIKIITNDEESGSDNSENGSSPEEGQFGAYGDYHSLSDPRSTKRQKLDDDINELLANIEVASTNASSFSNNLLLNFIESEPAMISDCTNGMEDDDADVWEKILAGVDLPQYYFTTPYYTNSDHTYDNVI